MLWLVLAGIGLIVFVACGGDFKPSGESRINRLAVISVVSGLAWPWGTGSMFADILGSTALVDVDLSNATWLWVAGPILAIVLGNRALDEIDLSDGTESGRRMAIAGVTLGWIGILSFFIVVVIVARGPHHFG
jgi:hypothetical protein